MNKLTGSELIKKLKEVYEDNLSAFAYGESTEIPKDFVFSEKAQADIKLYEETMQSLKTHPAWNDNKKQDATWHSLVAKKASLSNPWIIQFNEYLSSEGIGEFEEVEQYGGEGQGDTWYSVKYFPQHDIYLKVSGYYASHSGTDFYGWNDVVEVSPKEKTITVYE